MSLTSIAKPLLMPRMWRIGMYAAHSEEIQRKVLHHLVAAAADTEWGKEHGFREISSYEDFARQSPLTDYESAKGYIDRMRHGEADVLWRGRVKWYAKSSGTTNDKSKFIPVSPEGLKRVHYAGPRDAVAIYLHNNPKSRIFDGRSLILGGSHAPNYNLPDSLVGDLSAILIENIPSIVNTFRVPSKKTALLADFMEKRDKIAREAMNKNVTNISGVPSWMLSVLDRMLELSGKKYVNEVWPNLEVFFHGGVAFTPYRERYHQIINNPEMNYMETYNASEGFFGIQNEPSDPAMLLMIDYDVFYEFIPLEEVGKPDAKVVPLWDVELGRNYAMVITTSCGLWRYQIGDTVKFTSKNPYKFVISGRTKSFINAFGEELMVDNAEKGLAEACDKTGAVVAEYTAAPVFMDVHGKCRHQWVVEFAKRPDDIEKFADELDKALQRINSDYEAKRSNNVTLQRLEIVEAKPGLFDRWLASKGKLGGQHKVPRLSNNRAIIDEILALNN